MSKKITSSSGNVFIDLGFGLVEAKALAAQVSKGGRPAKQKKLTSTERARKAKKDLAAHGGFVLSLRLPGRLFDAVDLSRLQNRTKTRHGECLRLINLALAIERDAPDIAGVYKQWMNSKSKR